MKAVLAQWIEEQLASDVTRIELWELATPQQRLATYNPRATPVAAIAHEIDLRVSAATLTSARDRDCVGHALFAYVNDRAEDEAIGRALLRDGVLRRADFAATLRVLSMLLRQCEASARIARVVEEAGFVQEPRRKSPRRPRASDLRTRSK